MRLAILQAFAPELTQILPPQQESGFVTPEPQAGMAPPEHMYDETTGMPLNYIQQQGSAREFYLPQGGVAVPELRGRMDTVDGPQNLLRGAQGGRRGSSNYGMRDVVSLPPGHTAPQTGPAAPRLRNPNFTLGVEEGAELNRQMRQDREDRAAVAAPRMPPGEQRPNIQVGIGEGPSATARVPNSANYPRQGAPARTSNPPTGAPAPLDTEMFPQGNVQANMREMGRQRNNRGREAAVNERGETLGSMLEALGVRLQGMVENVRGSTTRAGTASPVGEPRQGTGLVLDSTFPFLHDENDFIPLEDVEAQRELRRFGNRLQEGTRRRPPVLRDEYTYREE